MLGPAAEALEDRTLLDGALFAGSLDPGFNQTGLVATQVGKTKTSVRERCQERGTEPRTSLLIDLFFASEAHVMFERTRLRSLMRPTRRLRPVELRAELLEDRTLLTTVVSPPPAISLPPGSLDPTFNEYGEVTTQIGVSDGGGVAVLQPGDGKILVAGTITDSDGSPTIALVRYLPNGQLDSSFGSGGSGVYALDPALEINAADAVAIVNAPQQPDDGDIVVAGTHY